jgi:hypothetical protein
VALIVEDAAANVEVAGTMIDTFVQTGMIVRIILAKGKLD